MIKQGIYTLLVVLAGSTILLSNCATQQTDVQVLSSQSTAVPIDMIVTGSAEGAPDGCTAETVTERLVDMAAAVNSADPNMARDFFGGQWYCTIEEGQPFTAYTTPELEAHLQRRYAQHERWQVASINVNGWEQTRGIIHFGPVVIWRTADDLEKPFESMGKGAYSCERQRFVVLCLGGETETAP